MQPLYCQSPKQPIKKDSCLHQFQKLLSESLNRKQAIQNKENTRSSFQMRSYSKLQSPPHRSIPINNQLNQDLKKTLNRVKSMLDKAYQENLALKTENKELLQLLQEKNLLIEKLQQKKSISQHS
ncbi:unnamed protein product (macronuclear) [Paramecium tetraurelia]|uniref:Uncharacterized protein n=1 Tax=Paramecium tetraurelia TaxID=5888 RepID=A0CGE0_PARTE|nr:uncharacterized protein GSPATT00007297001 [Paramecium tetraurelia]CAK69857.1 unnamed protein product [Paramecium tetraurelia]|eukprot:XP_001437254.1 hypothetical protein (macronuclear) [Paramecium tetraurelia strain d4-2]